MCQEKEVTIYGGLRLSGCAGDWGDQVEGNWMRQRLKVYEECQYFTSVPYLIDRGNVVCPLF